MYLNEDQFPSHQGNIVRFLRSLVLSKNSQSMQKKNKVFGRDLRLHLEDTKQDSKYFEKDHKTEKEKN